jgi:hypothetical protein
VPGVLTQQCFIQGTVCSAVTFARRDFKKTQLDSVCGPRGFSRVGGVIIHSFRRQTAGTELYFYFIKLSYRSVMHIHIYVRPDWSEERRRPRTLSYSSHKI